MGQKKVAAVGVRDESGSEPQLIELRLEEFDSWLGERHSSYTIMDGYMLYYCHSGNGRKKNPYIADTQTWDGPIFIARIDEESEDLKDHLLMDEVSFILKNFLRKRSP